MHRIAIALKWAFGAATIAFDRLPPTAAGAMMSRRGRNGTLGGWGQREERETGRLVDVREFLQDVFVKGRER